MSTFPIHGQARGASFVSRLAQKGPRKFVSTWPAWNGRWSGSAIRHHLDQLEPLLLRFEGDARNFAMKRKGYAVQGGEMKREG